MPRAWWAEPREPCAHTTGTFTSSVSQGADSRSAVSSARSAVPSRRRAARVRSGSDSHPSSPINRRMKASAASSGEDAAAAAPAVVPGHHGIHDIGVSYTPTPVTEGPSLTEAASATFPP